MQCDKEKRKIAHKKYMDYSVTSNEVKMYKHLDKMMEIQQKKVIEKW